MIQDLAGTRERYLEGWHSVIFSDEKKFNLHGPDGNQFYWHDLRKEEEYFSKRPSGGGSVMIWAAFGYNHKTQIVLVKGLQKSEDYINVMRNHLLPNAENLAGENWIFKQDNASIHVSKYSKKWFSDQTINLLDWPSKISDLNPIENLWGILVRKVYSNGRQFHSVAELKKEILKCWDEIRLETTQNLIDSMNQRIIQILIKNGKFIGY